MADWERPLGALVDPPLAGPPPLADIEERARRHRTRRRVGSGAGAALAVVALIAGVVALNPSGEQTVHTASNGGHGASLAQGTASVPGPQGGTALDTFEAGGQTWRLNFAPGFGPCVDVRSDTAVAGELCWQGGPLQAASVHVAETTYLFGLVDGSATQVRFGADAELPIVGGTIAGSLGPATTVGRPDNGVKVFAKVMPTNLATVTLEAATGTNPRAYSLTVTLHARVAIVNGQDSPSLGAPTTTAVRDQTPGGSPPATPVPTTAAPPTTTPMVTSPPTTVPPLIAIPKLITITPGATDLHKIRFESAVASGSNALAVRYWAGVEPCTVLGKVDVVESADKVTVTVWIGSGNALMICTALAQYFETIVPLSAPLGARAVVDGGA